MTNPDQLSEAVRRAVVGRGLFTALNISDDLNADPGRVGDCLRYMLKNGEVRKVARGIYESTGLNKPCRNDS